MNSVRLNQFLNDLVRMKETLQESLHLFRLAQKRLNAIESGPDTFLYRRHIQLESEALINFKNDIKKMNEVVEKLLLETEEPLEHSTDWQAFQQISRELKAIQNAFDRESPALEAALQKVESRFQKE